MYGHRVIGAAVHLPAEPFFAHTAPRLEEERDILFFTLLADILRSLFPHRPRHRLKHAPDEVHRHRFLK